MFKTLGNIVSLNQNTVPALILFGLIFLSLFFFYKKENPLTGKTAWTLNLSIASFFAAITFWSMDNSKILYSILIWIVFIVFALIILVGATAMIHVIYGQLHQKRVSKHNWISIVSIGIIAVIILGIQSLSPDSNLPIIIKYLSIFTPFYLLYLSIVGINFITQAIITYLSAKKNIKNNVKVDYLFAPVQSGLNSNLQMRNYEFREEFLENNGDKITNKIIASDKGSVYKNISAPTFSESVSKFGEIAQRQQHKKPEELNVGFATNTFQLIRTGNELRKVGLTNQKAFAVKSDHVKILANWGTEFVNMLIINRYRHLFVLLAMIIISLNLAFFNLGGK
jgi:hypothetical protein